MVSVGTPIRAVCAQIVVGVGEAAPDCCVDRHARRVALAYSDPIQHCSDKGAVAFEITACKQRLSDPRDGFAALDSAE